MLVSVVCPYALPCDRGSFADNNEWLIFDFKQFTPGTPPSAGALWVIDQLVGVSLPPHTHPTHPHARVLEKPDGSAYCCGGGGDDGVRLGACVHGCMCARVHVCASMRGPHHCPARVRHGPGRDPSTGVAAVLGLLQHAVHTLHLRGLCGRVCGV